MSRLIIAVWLVSIGVFSLGCGGDTKPESATPATEQRATEPQSKADAEAATVAEERNRPVRRILDV